MKTELIKSEDGFLFPAYPDDIARVKRLPVGEIIIADLKSNRNNNHNSQLWAIIGFFFEHKHEIYDKIFKSKDVFYEWLKLEVGFSEVIRSPITGEYKEIPKRSNFLDCPDEDEYMHGLHNKALLIIASLMQVTVYELKQASIDFKNNRGIR